MTFTCDVIHHANHFQVQFNGSFNTLYATITPSNSRTFSSSRKESTHSLPPTPAPGNQESASCLFGCAYSGHFIETESCDTLPFVSASFTQRDAFELHPTVQHVSPLHSLSWPISHCVERPCLVYLFIIWWTFGLFPLLTTVNNDATNTHVQVCVWTPVFNSLGYSPRSQIAGSCGDAVSKFPRNHQTAFIAVSLFLFLQQNFFYCDKKHIIRFTI